MTGRDDRAPTDRLLRAIALIVPRVRRAEWLAEWRGETAHARMRGEARGDSTLLVRARLLARTWGAVRDAVWLRTRLRERRGQVPSGGRPSRGGGPLRALHEASRSLRRRPGFSLAVVVTLALGMGAATAIFTVVDNLMVRPPPFRDAAGLVSVTGSGGGMAVDAEAVVELRAAERTFAEVRAYLPTNYVVTGAGDARRYVGWHVEPGMLEMLGIVPALGRGFTAAQVDAGMDRVVLLSDDVWREAFGRDPAAVGRTIELDGEPHTVIGVLPPSLRRLPLGIVQMILPLVDAHARDRLPVLARLQPGVTLDEATEHVTALARGLEAERPRDQGWTLGVRALDRTLSDGVKNGFLTLAAAVSFLLLIACANAAGLLVLRGVSRRPEFALRSALGGSRGSLVGQVLAESLLLALAAGVLGTLLAWGAVRGILAILPTILVRYSYTTVQIDGRVLGFAFLLTTCTGLVCGMLPALRATDGVAARAGHGATASRREVRLRAAVQVGQFALTVVLLAGAGLFGRSFASLSAVPTGFDPDHHLQLALVSLEQLRGDPEATVAFARELDQRLGRLPGVVGVSRASGVGFRSNYEIELDDGEVHPAGDDLLPHLTVGGGYFDFMGIEIVEGRPFRPDEAESGSGSVIVDRDLADALWPGRSAVGRSFRIASEDPVTVVGVTADVKLEGPLDPLGPYLLFYPAELRTLRSATVLIRTTGDPAALIPRVRALVREMDPDQPISSLRTGREALGESVANSRFILVMMIAFSAVAIVLASVGVYGLVSFTVVQRTREIGIRRVMGARAGRVAAEIVGWGFLLGLAGAALGLAAAAILTRFVSALLFGVSPLDPLSLATAIGALLIACAAALLLPALRTARVPPSEALRVE